MTVFGFRLCLQPWLSANATRMVEKPKSPSSGLLGQESLIQPNKGRFVLLFTVLFLRGSMAQTSF